VDQLFADEKVTSLGTTGSMLWALTDHENSIRDLATYDSGTDTTTVANHRIYDSYGNLTSETNSAVDCLFGWTGRYKDSATGLQNNLNRWYDPTTGAWISKDPISFAAGDANLYRYCGNNSLNYVDPLGLAEEANNHAPLSDPAENNDINYSLDLSGLDVKVPGVGQDTEFHVGLGGASASTSYGGVDFDITYDYMKRTYTTDISFDQITIGATLDKNGKPSGHFNMPFDMFKTGLSWSGQGNPTLNASTSVNIFGWSTTFEASTNFHGNGTSLGAFLGTSVGDVGVQYGNGVQLIIRPKVTKNPKK
jgi:RHS repeat-associated protein